MSGVVSSFRGVAGQVSLYSLKFSTILTAICMSVIIGVVVLVFSFIGGRFITKIPMPVLHLIILIAPAMWAARFALAASDGDLTAGYFNRYLVRGAVSSFVLRYAIFTCMWYVPISLLFYLFEGHIPYNPVAVLFSQSMVGISSMKVLFLTMALFALNVLYVAMPILCYILSTHTSTLEEVLSPEPWQWLFFDRREDLKPFFVTFLGTLAVFCLWFFIPGAFIIFILTKVMLSVSRNPFYIFGVMGMLISLTLFSYGLILVGRLSGAFVFGEGEFDLDDEMDEETLVQQAKMEVAMNINSETGEPLHSEAELSQKNVPAQFSAEQLLKDTNELTPQELADRSSEARSSLCSSPQAVYWHIQLAFVLLKMAKQSESIEAASKAISFCFRNGRIADGLFVYQTFQSDRAALKISGEQWMALGKAGLAQGMYADAAWCTYQGMQVLNAMEDINHHKAFLNVAHTAKEKGDLQQAQAIYRFYLKKFPNASLADFVREQLGE